MRNKIFQLFLCFSIIFIELHSLMAREGQAYTIIENKAKLPILTPSFSERKTLKIRLSNGLEAYLISDPQMEKSAAALAVKTGSWEEPEEYPGLAHFLEHMLFLGTEKFPEEAEYRQFISDHGGYSNAFTTNDSTSYMFSINNDFFPAALDRFSSFFKEPLFNPSGVSRELKAIDQEYGKNLNNDDIRELYVMKELENPQHPDHRFGMGNSKTLSKVSQDTLKKWYKEHYSANLMRLIVYSPLPLEELSNMVVKDFSGIPNTDKPFMKFSIPIVSEELEGKIVYVKPIKNIRQLSLLWEMTGKFAEMKDSQPGTLACYVLGHEGKESLLAELKKEKLAESLSCGVSQTGPGVLDFYIDISLTDEGVKLYEKVIDLVFGTIAILKKNGIPPYIYDEVKKVQTMKYQYQQKEDPFFTAIHDISLIVHEDISTFPEQSNIIQKYDPQDIKEFIAQLTPKNTEFYLMAPSALTGVKPDSVEKWLSVEYAVREISPEKMKKWSSISEGPPSIDLPSFNPFIPKTLSLVNEIKEDIKKLPLVPSTTNIIKNEGANIYYAMDKRFKIPKIYWYYEIKTPEIAAGEADKLVMAFLFTKGVDESLNKFSYPAKMAGLDYKVDVTDEGLSIEVSGYSENAPLLFEEIVKTIKQYKPNRLDFQLYKSSLQREYENFALESPLRQAYEILKEAFYKEFTTQEEKANAIKKITFEDFSKFCEKLFEKSYVQGILYGNLTEQEARQVSEKLIQTLGYKPYPKSEQEKTKVIVLPKNEGPFYIDAITKAKGNATVLAIEELPFSFKSRAAQQILMKGMEEAFFTSLRTVQQTGYIVDSSPEEWERCMFNIFAVQSNTHDVRDLLARFELFIEGYLQEMGKKEFTEEQFNIIKEVSIAKLKEPQNNVENMGILLKTLAFKYEGDFEWLNKRIKGLEELSYAEFIDLSYQFMGRGNKRRFAVLLRGDVKETGSLNYSPIKDVNQLKKMSTFTSH